MMDSAQAVSGRYQGLSPSAVHATPRQVAGPQECFFYHTMELPGHGLVQGAWDLRGRLDEYLGGIELRGKRVLELGTASGQVCFHMERQGAEVVAFDLAPDRLWDFVPSPRLGDPREYVRQGVAFFKRLHNSYWLAHQAHGSRARVVYGSVYDIPAEIGPVDVTTYGCILLHLRDPFLALANGLRLTRERAVITQTLHGRPWEGAVMGRAEAPAAPPPGRRFLRDSLRRLLRRLAGVPGPASHQEMVPCMAFLPDSQALATLPVPDVVEQVVTWWFFTPEVLRQMLGCLGFEESRVTYHEQIFHGQVHRLYTIVAERTRPMPGRIDGPYPWF